MQNIQVTQTDDSYCDIFTDTEVFDHPINFIAIIFIKP